MAKCIVEGCRWAGYPDTKKCYPHSKADRVQPPEGVVYDDDDFAEMSDFEQAYHYD